MWQESFPNGENPKPVPGHIDHRKRHRWHTWAVLAALSAVVLAGVSYEGVRRWEHFTQSNGFFSGFGQGLQRAIQGMQSGGNAANAAATVAAPKSPGSLTPASLNLAVPKYQWVDASSNVTSAAKRPIVSILVGGTHVETAVEDQAGDCSFGLVISSPTDPLTAVDHVAGIGIYYHLVRPGTYYQSVYDAPRCAADQAPTSGWSTWPSPLSAP